jgi:transcriptional antiterminator NusG
MALKWYVVHAYSQYEKKVATAIQERVERLGMQDRFGEIIVPTEEVIEMKGGQKRKSERKFFPGYVLVQMDLDDDTWHLVKKRRACWVLSAVRQTSPRRLPTRKPT